MTLNRFHAHSINALHLLHNGCFFFFFCLKLIRNSVMFQYLTRFVFWWGDGSVRTRIDGDIGAHGYVLLYVRGTKIFQRLFLLRSVRQDGDKEWMDGQCNRRK